MTRQGFEMTASCEARFKSEVLVIDVETTGFDPCRHACIELGAVLLDLNLRPVQEFSSLVAPWAGFIAEPASMAINKISVEELHVAPPIPDVVEHFNKTFNLQTRKPLLAGWNVWFDVEFLRSLYARAGRTWPFSHRLLDVQSIVTFHAAFASVSQEEVVRKTFAERQRHRAVNDAFHTSRILHNMAERFLSGK
jgi:DNA polymerase III epsilon subunit-like protein